MDETETKRREMVKELNEKPRTREELAGAYGQVWDTQELQNDFAVQGFAAPFCIVSRKKDGRLGTVLFQHNPRYYFGFETEEGKT